MGWLFLLIVLALIVYMVVINLPDLKRYLKIRSM